MPRLPGWLPRTESHEKGGFESAEEPRACNPRLVDMQHELNLQRGRERANALLRPPADRLGLLMDEALAQPAGERRGDLVGRHEAIEPVEVLAELDVARVRVRHHVAKEREHVCPEKGAHEHHHAYEDSLLVGRGGWVKAARADVPRTQGDRHGARRCAAPRVCVCVREA